METTQLTSNTLKISGYCRVSLKSQIKGISLEAQQERIKEYAIIHNIDLVSMHVDAGVSGRSLDRPALQAALRDIRGGKSQGLIILRLDRLTRSIQDFNYLINEYFAKDGNHTIISIEDLIDFKQNPIDLKKAYHLVSLHELECQTTTNRTRSSLEYLKSKGVQLGGAALGWSRLPQTDNDGHRIVAINHSEVAIVARIIDLHNEGKSLRQIAKVLVTEGHKTKRGGKWHAQTISKILNRPKKIKNSTT